MVIYLATCNMPLGLIVFGAGWDYLSYSLTERWKSWLVAFPGFLPCLASLCGSLFHIRGLSASLVPGNKRGGQIPLKILGEMIFFISRTSSYFFFLPWEIRGSVETFSGRCEWRPWVWIFVQQRCPSKADTHLSSAFSQKCLGFLWVIPAWDYDIGYLPG